MPKHFFFDLDNTLTRSRSHITPTHAEILQTLTEHADVIVVTGGQRSQVIKQLDPELAGKYFILAQNGNEAYHKDGTCLWENKPTPAQKTATLALIEKMCAHLALSVQDEKDLIEDRGCSIAYSTIGHHEDVTKKEQYDPDHSKRLELIETFRPDVDRLRTELGIEVRTGGTTCLDFFGAGLNKGYNIREFLTTMHWEVDDSLYIGDALFPGGNDETVVGVIPTHAVKNPDDTFAFITQTIG
jgi:HAD superfamily hydrolase (TIGR01484 family)